MTPLTAPSSTDPDMRAAPAALLRAARRAREIARDTGTAVVVMEGGRLVEETGAGLPLIQLEQARKHTRVNEPVAKIESRGG